MFWNEPSLYGATFPYRDIPTPVQTPLMGPVIHPWQQFQQFQRFAPPTYGLNQPFINVPPMLHTPMVNPMYFSQFTQPYLRPFDVPQMRWDLPLHNFYRPFF